jgi:hypothetical protein
MSEERKYSPGTEARIDALKHIREEDRNSGDGDDSDTRSYKPEKEEDRLPPRQEDPVDLDEV